MSNWNTPPLSLTPSSIKGIHHIGLSVSDVAETAKFYQQTTQMIAGKDRISGGLPIEPERTATLAAPNGYIELMQFADAPTPQAIAVEGPGFTHVCYQSPAPDALFSKFIALGAHSVSTGEPPIDLGGYGVRYGYARDADQVMFEIEQLDEPKFEGPIWIAHVALVSHDLDRLVNFYQHLLGIEPYQRTEGLRGRRADNVTGIQGVNIRAAWFNTGNMIIEIWQYTRPMTQAAMSPNDFSQPGYNKFALQVSDLSAECKRLIAAGIELSKPLEREGVTEVYARDPDGNLFSLLSVRHSDDTTVDNLKKIDWLPSPANPQL